MSPKTQNPTFSYSYIFPFFLSPTLSLYTPTHLSESSKYHARALLSNRLYFKSARAVTAYGSANVYATIKARKDGKNFWWESGWSNIRFSEEKAEIGRLLVLSNPYTAIGKTISAEATIKGLRKNGELRLEFWVETPSGRSEEQATIDIKDLAVGEEARYAAEFTPQESGIYHIYAYLYDGWRRIGYETEFIYARKQ